jgi:hypothetical protein
MAALPRESGLTIVDLLYQAQAKYLKYIKILYKIAKKQSSKLGSIAAIAIRIVAS